VGLLSIPPALGLGNVTGAMVFQSMIPVGIGLLFTDWDP
jgi:cation:H+ antiporter